MKNLWKLLFVIPLVICLSTDALSQETHGKFGVGLVFGEPTGFAWKYRLDDVNAVDGAIGIAPYDRFRMHVDYLWMAHPFDERRLMLHYGPGLAIGGGNSYYYLTDHGYFLHSEELGFGVRADVGLDYQIKQTPLELFLDVAPLFIVAPGPGTGLDLGFGGRFYF